MGKSYRVLVGMNYPPGDKRAEPGDIVDDIPAGSIDWLLRDGAIEPAEINEVKAYAETATAEAEALSSSDPAPEEGG